MEYATFVEHVRTDGSRLADAAEGDGTAPVPSCPGWSVRDLVAHVAQVYEHKIQCTRLGHAPDPWPPEWPQADEPVPWFRDAHSRLLQMFDESEATTPSATWWPADQTVGFWARRMAHETAVHRVDAELARGASTPVDAALATDGVDEILHLMLEGDWSDDADDAMTRSADRHLDRRTHLADRPRSRGRIGHRRRRGGRREAHRRSLRCAAVAVGEGPRRSGRAGGRRRDAPTDADASRDGDAVDGLSRRGSGRTRCPRGRRGRRTDPRDPR